MNVGLHIDRMCSQMLRENTAPGQWGELTKYKCLVPAQKRLPNALVETKAGQ